MAFFTAVPPTWFRIPPFRSENRLAIPFVYHGHSLNTGKRGPWPFAALPSTPRRIFQIFFPRIDPFFRSISRRGPPKISMHCAEPTFAHAFRAASIISGDTPPPTLLGSCLRSSPLRISGRFDVPGPTLFLAFAPSYTIFFLDASVLPPPFGPASANRRF